MVPIKFPAKVNPLLTYLGNANILLRGRACWSKRRYTIYLVAASHPRKTQFIPQIKKTTLITFTNISTFIQLSICSDYCKVSLT